MTADPMQRARVDRVQKWADSLLIDQAEEWLVDLRETVRLAYLALTREEDGWQSIETAPRDGTAVLIFEPGKGRESHMPIAALEPGECTYRASDPRLKWYDDKRYAIGYWRPWGDGSWGNRNSTTVQPTHWRPLPAPPAIRSANCGGGA